jgi:hypothetical protein
LWDEARARGLDRISGKRGAGASGDAIAFFRTHDLGFRIRRLRFLARELDTAVEATRDGRDPVCEEMREAIFTALGLYLDRQGDAWLAGLDLPTDAGPGDWIDAVAARRDLTAIDGQADALIAAALAAMPKDDRRTLLLAYLGYPFYDIATLPLLQGEGFDEYDPIKIDRISPSDATAIRTGGAAAMLKGIEFNSFGAFFSRAYRENDYLWGRLHGADRLIDIVASSVGGEKGLVAEELKTLKRRAFHAILDEEEARLPKVAALIDGAQGRDRRSAKSLLPLREKDTKACRAKRTSRTWMRVASEARAVACNARLDDPRPASARQRSRQVCAALSRKGRGKEPSIPSDRPTYP